MDYWIIIISVLSFVLFLASLVIAFRFVHPYDAVGWYVRLSLLWAVCCVVLWVYIMGLSLSILAPLALYGLLVVLFLFGVFGILEASITLHLLTILFRAGRGGIHPNAILSTYNRTSIVKRRIDRLLWSGQLIVVGGYYRLSRRTSYFTAREKFLEVLRFLFPHP